MDVLIEWAVVIAALLVFSYFSLRKKALNKDGIIGGNIVGLLVYRIGGLESFVVIVAFFLIAEASTRLSRRKQKEGFELRNTGNVFGNSGAAILALLFGSIPAFFGALSTALADTVSSEIGMLSKRKPRLLTSLKQVEAGTDGGVTVLGLAAGLAGAISIGLIYYYLNANLILSIVITAAGCIGMLVDSLLGGLFERKGKMNNMEVNFLASLSGAIITFAAGLML